MKEVKVRKGKTPSLVLKEEEGSKVAGYKKFFSWKFLILVEAFDNGKWKVWGKLSGESKYTFTVNEVASKTRPKYYYKLH